MQQVGVQGIFDVNTQFNKGLKEYLKGIDQAAGGATKLGGGFSQSTSGLSKLGSSIKSTGEGLLKFGLIAGGAALAGVTALGAGLATFAASGIKQAADLDQKMADIAAVMGKTKDAVTPLKDEILKLSIDPQLRVNATQAAEAIELLARNGLTMTQILDGAAKSTIALANATKADFGTAADIATDVMAIFNIEAKDMERAVDGITGVTTHSKLTIDDYAYALANSGAVAQGMGLSFEDLNATIAATASSFSSGRDAGTSLKTLLQRLSKPTKEMQAEMDKYGISLFDSNGKMRDMSSIIDDLHRAFGGLNDQQKAQLATTLGGADGSRQIIALAKLEGDEFNKLSAEVNANGQALKAAATRVDSYSGAIDILKSVFQSIQIQVGDKFLPLVKQLIVDFTDLAVKIGPKIVTFLGNMASKIGSVIQTAKNFASTFISNFQRMREMGFGIIESIFGGLSGALSGIGLDANSGPIFEFIQSLRILVQTVFGDITGTISESGFTIQGALSAAFGFITNAILPALTTAIQFVTEHWDAFKGAIMGVAAALAGSAIVALIAGVITAISAIISPIGLIIVAAAALGAAWNTNFLGIRDIVLNVWETSIKPAFFALVEWLQTNIPVAIQAMSTFWTTTLLPAMTNVGNWISTTLVPIFTDVQTWLKDNLPQAVTALAGVWTNTLLPAGQGIWNFIKDDLIPFFNKLKDIYIEHFSELIPLLKEVFQEITAVWRTEVKPALDELWEALGDLAEALGIATTETETASGGMSAFDVILVAIKGTLWLVREAVSAVTVVIKPLGEALTFMIHEVSSGIQDFIAFKNAIQGLSDSTKSWLDRIKELAAALVDLVLPAWLQPGSPTPLEIGITGINEQLLGAVSRIRNLGLEMRNLASLEVGLANRAAGNSISNISNDNRQINVVVNGGTTSSLSQSQQIQMTRMAIQQQFGPI